MSKNTHPKQPIHPQKSSDSLGESYEEFQRNTFRIYRALFLKEPPRSSDNRERPIARAGKLPHPA